MKVLLVSVEVAPFAWAGGMGDVAGSLPKALRELGLDVRVMMPEHRGSTERAESVRRAVESCTVHMPWWVTGCGIDEATLPGSDVPVYFIEHQQYFDRKHIYGPPGAAYPDNLERFAFFCRAVIESFRGLQWQPDIVHLNDWHTSLLALYQKQWDLDFRTAYTAHQLGAAFHGTFPADEQPLAGIDLGRLEARQFVRGGQIDLARAGLTLAAVANTVSPRYAYEVAQPGSEEDVWDIVGERGEAFCGILNGIDYSNWNPSADESIATGYDAQNPEGKLECKAELQRLAGLEENPATPVVGMVSRLDTLKGFDLVVEALPRLSGVQFVFLGTGDPRYAGFLRGAAAVRDDVAAFLAFDTVMARKIYAGSDILLMPSRREPSGLAQMIALAYGTAPVVHATGGLADTITEDPARQNGFVFETYSTQEMEKALGRATDLYRDEKQWRELVRRGMSCDFSWERSAKRYVQMYERALSE